MLANNLVRDGHVFTATIRVTSMYPGNRFKQTRWSKELRQFCGPRVIVFLQCMYDSAVKELRILRFYSKLADSFAGRFATKTDHDICKGEAKKLLFNTVEKITPADAIISLEASGGFVWTKIKCEEEMEVVIRRLKRYPKAWENVDKDEYTLREANRSLLKNIDLANYYNRNFGFRIIEYDDYDCIQMEVTRNEFMNYCKN